VPEVPPVPDRIGLNAREPYGASSVAELVDRSVAIFAPDGPLARAVHGFEPRQGQIEMAAAVARLLDAGGVLLAEAGTGTGKTLAYLVPAILSRQRVLVSTGTKNLQEQIFFKDLPALREALGIPFTSTLMKGRANYLCLHRLDQLDDAASAAAHDIFLPTIQHWSKRTETGDRAELGDLPEDLPFWNEVAATADTCLGAECPRFDECFVTRMRQQAASSDLVIVNHHLLCADAAVRQHAHGAVIPACSSAVIDEAHQLEDVATQHFGCSVSTYRLEELARDAERLPMDDIRGKLEVAKAVEQLRACARAFFADLLSAHRRPRESEEGAGSRGADSPARRPAERGRRPATLRNDERVRATEESLAGARDAAASLVGALDLLESRLSPTRPSGLPAAEEDEPAGKDREAVARRARELRDEIRLLMRAGDPSFVYFVELRGRGVFLRSSPIDVSSIIRTLLLERIRATVLTSATLTVDGTFDYARARLGIAAADEIRLESEFDFARQAVLYLPKRMPDPRSADFALAAGRQVVEILKRTRGRAFVLFTSYATLREVKAVAEMALEYPLLVQGTAPRTQLLKQFRETPHAVLFATSSFWQGVDVVGESLSCVIVDKLPFASPADPVTSARIDAIRARGGGPFEEYQVPLAVLALQQGLGRLIRHRGDRGVLAVLDPRIRTKAYGRRFIASIPRAPVVHELDAIEGFFSSIE
jgi:ATP-dependent DNA helicase DinG